MSLVAIAADGVITEEEARGMFVQFYRMKTFSGFSDNQMSSMLTSSSTSSRSRPGGLGQPGQGVPAGEHEGHRLRRGHRPALADGEIAEEEKKLLTKVQQSLGLPEDEAVKIIEVMMIKNKG